MTTINKDILRLAVPSILANITIPLVGIVDTAIVGHLCDAVAIGGIAIGTMLFDLLYWNFGFLRVGTSGLTAQAYGAGNSKSCRRLLQQTIGVALTASMAILLIQWIFVTLVLLCVPCSPEVANVAREYFFIRIWAAPATLCLFSCKGWFIGMQDTRSPMAVDITVNVVNMVASYFLAVNAGLGVAGVAWGTFIAQYTGLLLTIGILLIRYQIHRSEQWNIAGDIVKEFEWKRYFSFNGNLFLRSLCFMVVYVGYTSLASQYGDTELAVSSILMKLFMFFSFFVDGFAYAGEALVGKAFGQMEIEKSQKVRGLVHSLFNWAIGVGLFFTIVYAICGKSSIALLTSDAEVIAASTKYMGWLIAMPIISTLAFMWDGVFVGATAGIQIRNSMIWAALVFVICYVATFRFVGPQALYIAYFAHLIARAIYLTVEWKKVYIY